jgi:hypothetical protein
VCQSLNLLAIEYKPVVDLFAALLTPVVAGIAVSIAWRQKQIAQNKLKLDLFEKRFACYKQVEGFIQHTAELQFKLPAEIDGYLHRYSRFLSETLETALFLFNDRKLEKWLEELKRKAADHYCNVQEIKSLPEGGIERLKKQEAANEMGANLWGDIEKLLEKFRPHLTIEAS